MRERDGRAKADRARRGGDARPAAQEPSPSLGGRGQGEGGAPAVRDWRSAKLADLRAAPSPNLSRKCGRGTTARVLIARDAAGRAQPPPRGARNTRIDRILSDRPTNRCKLPCIAPLESSCAPVQANATSAVGERDALLVFFPRLRGKWLSEAKPMGATPPPQSASLTAPP